MDPLEQETELAQTHAPCSSGSAGPQPEERYHYEQSLGAGGMGQVYAVFDRRLRRHVALKVAHADHPAERLRFVEEAQLTGRLDHPGIVPVYDLGADGAGRPVYTMKQVRGRSLQEEILRLREDPAVAREFGLVRRLEIFNQIARAVGFAHAQGIIHRDLKPANVMLGAFGEVLVMDWGLAKQLATPEHEAPPTARDEAGLVTLGGAAIGTPGYMPPEQIRGELERIDPRSDIFSLGATLYELLALVAPYDGGSAREVMDRTLAGPPPRPSSIAREPVPPELEAICARAMAAEPEQRYQTALELADEVTRFLEGRPVLARPDPLRVRLIKWLRRHRALAGALFSMLLVSSLVGALVWRATRRRAAHEHAQRVERLQAAGDELLATALRSLQAVDREARELAAAPREWNALVAWRRKLAAEQLDRRRESAKVELERAASGFRQVLALAPGHAAAREGLDRCRHRLWRLALQSGREREAAYHAERLRRSNRYRAELLAGGALRIESQPAGATAHLFRFVEAADGRLVPVPFAPGRGALYDPLEQPGRATPTDPAERRQSIYRLERTPANRLGATPLALDALEPGSYLVLIEAPGRVAARCPVVIARGSPRLLSVPLPQARLQPPGFCYVPPGRAKLGGDPYHPWAGPPRTVELPGFFIARDELTLGEYYAFLRAQAAIDRAQARAWMPAYTPRNHQLPAAGMPLAAALAYAAWRAARDGIPYRLPTADEWGATARGADGRPYVWGRHYSPAFVVQLERGISILPVAPHRAVAHEDESLYGVRDLSSGVREWTVTPDPRPEKRKRSLLVCGGLFSAPHSMYRAAARGSVLADNPKKLLIGIRLIVRLKDFGPAQK